MKWRFDLLDAGVYAGALGSLDLLRRVARGEASLETLMAAPGALPPPLRLAASERRRASQAVRLVMACVEQVLAQPAVATAELRCIFAADEGTGEICPQLLEAVTTTRQVSPMVFTNSVQNAPSGYFAIGYHNRRSATVISQGLESFACGLLCSLAELDESPSPVLLVTYDPVMSAPLSELHPVPDAYASAWLMAPAGALPGALARFEVELLPQTDRAMGPLPGWWPARWAGLASTPSIAALALLEAGVGASMSLPLNGVVLTLRRIDGSAA